MLGDAVPVDLGDKFRVGGWWLFRSFRLVIEFELFLGGFEVQLRFLLPENMLFSGTSLLLRFWRW